jgi:hypothetical protein
MEAGPHHDLIASITSDVMKCLQRSKFFEKLDDILSPSDGSQPQEVCSENYKLSEAIVRESGLEFSDFAGIFNVLRSQGGFCDCEVLYNASDSSRPA